MHYIKDICDIFNIIDICDAFNITAICDIFNINDIYISYNDIWYILLQI